MRFGEFSAVKVDGMPDFWSRVSGARHCLLSLDYDGTLAPFHIDPMRARPLPGIPERLAALGETRKTRVAIISGRPVRELRALLGDVGLTLIGCHGFETWNRDGGVVVRSPNPSAMEILRRSAEDVARRGIGGRLEVKNGGVVLHTRGMTPRDALEVEEAVWLDWSRMAAAGLGCRRFNGGVEMYCTDWNKALAFAALLDEEPAETLPVHIGDDVTDEDIFGFLRDKGIGIRVGPRVAETSAAGFLPHCEAVGDLLAAWLSLDDP